MNLTAAELAQLPLAAAVIDPHGALIARTREWEGCTPGAVSYPVRLNRLVVSTGNIDPDCTALLDQLLEALEAVGRAVDHRQAAQVAMLAGSLRLLAGREPSSRRGTSGTVLEHACIGIAARTSLRVTVEDACEQTVPAPEVIALILIQLAVNAEQHAGADSVRLTSRAPGFEVRWLSQCAEPTPLAVTRQRGARARWGMGFARIAADTVGGALFLPQVEPDGTSAASLELGLGRLALPLATVRRGRVLKATRAWDEESGCEPGTAVEAHPKLRAAVAGAVASRGRISVTDGWWGRAVRGDEAVWVAIPPDDILDRARDVLAGIVHERALWDGVPEPGRSRVYAVATLLDCVLGAPLPRVPWATWTRRYAELQAPFAITLPTPEFHGPGAVDPRVVVHLATARAASFEVEGDHLYLRAPALEIGAAARAFPRRADGALRLS